MFETSFTLPGLGEHIDLGAGTQNWGSPTRIQADGDDTFSLATMSTSDAAIQDLEVRFSDNGTLIGNNKADTGTNWLTATIPPDGNTTTYGSSTDLWGITYSNADLIALINSNDFELNVRARQGPLGPFTDRLRGSQFGFNIPTLAEILGIEVQFNKLRQFVSGRNQARVYWVKVKIHYKRKNIVVI